MKRTLVATLLLAGCAHREPQVEVREIHVPVPTPVHCVDQAEIPPEPKQVGDRFTGDAKQDLMILAPNAQELRKWGRQLRTLLENCASPEE